MTGLRGRLYWSKSHFDRMQEMANGGWFKELHTCIGRLDDGRELEYTDMQSEDSPDPEGDHLFLGVGEWIGIWRTFKNETPLEKIEMRLMSSPWLTESMRKDGNFVERWAKRLRDGR